MSTPTTDPDDLISALARARLTGYQQRAGVNPDRGFFVHVRSRPVSHEERLAQARADMAALRRRSSSSTPA